MSRLILSLLLLLPLAGCQTIGYYSQMIDGHFDIIGAREPIDKLIDDPATDQQLRRQLILAREAREFASRELGLPDNDSYRSYVDTGRDFVTMNVIAAPEFALQPKKWCFPIAGCVSYRGYYEEAAARRYGEELAAEGWDVAYSKAAAYSTLGWFDDPLLNTMLRGSDLGLVGLIFHELAHQQLYADDDSDFNEAYATFVEHEGIRRWLAARGREAEIDGYRARLARREDFVALLKKTRASLNEVYSSDSPTADKRTRKAAVFARLQRDYVALRDGKWAGYPGYNRWFDRELNNAHLGAVATYFRYVPAFAELYREAGSALPGFYAAAEKMAELSVEARKARLEALLLAAQESGKRASTE